MAEVRLRRGYGATVFANTVLRSENWRRGELNPCPRRYPRKHLHVYPALSSEKLTSHRLATSFRASAKRSCESGAVAPPIRQPAVSVSAASRRRCENVTVN